MKTTFTTFYCDYNDTDYYKKSVTKLKKKIESLGGRIIIHTPELAGTYNTICLIKPTIILNTLKEYKQDIIWIDADCEVNELPIEMDNITHDMAAVVRIHDMKTPHSALVLFRYNEKVLSFLQDWEQKCIDKSQEAENGTYRGGDHHLLIETLRERRDVQCVLLPMSVACSVNPNVKVFINISPGGQEE
jgi:hypothetical protein